VLQELVASQPSANGPSACAAQSCTGLEASIWSLGGVSLGLCRVSITERASESEVSKNTPVLFELGMINEDPFVEKTTCFRVQETGLSNSLPRFLGESGLSKSHGAPRNDCSQRPLKLKSLVRNLGQRLAWLAGLTGGVINRPLRLHTRGDGC